MHLPAWHMANLGSRVLGLCEQRVVRDWEGLFGHRVLLMETFVDAQRFRGTVYRAANWVYVGNTRGFRRTRLGYSATPESPKMVFVKPLQADARRLLCGAILPSPYSIGDSRMSLSAAQMESLPAFFSDIADPRRAEGRRHRLSTVLALSAGAVLCGMRGYHAIAAWVKKPAGASHAVATKTAGFSSPASSSSAMCSSASTRLNWIAHCNAGMKPMPDRIGVWPLTARRCATPWIKTAGRR